MKAEPQINPGPRAHFALCFDEVQYPWLARTKAEPYFKDPGPAGPAEPRDGFAFVASKAHPKGVPSRKTHPCWRSLARIQEEAVRALRRLRALISAGVAPEAEDHHKG